MADNWVVERAKCSLEGVFKKLELQVRDDVKEINQLRPDHQYIFTPNNVRFSVTSHTGISVDFSLTSKAIVISNNDNVLFEATLTLNDDGDCRINLKGKNGQQENELQFWQVRRRALEPLFF